MIAEADYWSLDIWRKIDYSFYVLQMRSQGVLLLSALTCEASHAERFCLHVEGPVTLASPVFFCVAFNFVDRHLWQLPPLYAYSLL